jgi:perosamine synthetase
MKIKIPLFRIYWDENDIQAVSELIKRGGYWATGPEIEKFEKLIAKYVGCEYSVVFNSGTSALQAILMAINIKKGDEVIVPSLSFVSTSNSVLFTGGKPVFADIENKTFSLDEEDVKRKITRKTKAIIPVHYAGCPGYYIKSIKDIAEDKNIYLIEDAAAALGAKIDQQKVGTFGDAAMFSFCQNKIITTGEGGVITSNSKELHRKLKLLVSHGKMGNNYISIGYNFRMPSMNAALGISQLMKIDKLIKMRRNLANSYNSLLEDIRDIKLNFPPKRFFHVYWIYHILIEGNFREKLRQHLLNSGVYSKLYYEPIHLTRYYKKLFNYSKGTLPNTEDFCNKSLSLPIFPSMKKEEINYIVQCIKELMI